MFYLHDRNLLFVLVRNWLQHSLGSSRMMWSHTWLQISAYIGVLKIYSIASTRGLYICWLSFVSKSMSKIQQQAMSAVWQSAAMLADPTICGNCFDLKQTYSMGKQSSPSRSLSTYFCAISSMFHIFLCKHWLIGPMGYGKLCTMYKFFSCLSKKFWEYHIL